MALSPRMFKGTYAGAPSSVSTEKLFTSSHDTEEVNIAFPLVNNSRIDRFLLLFKKKN